MLNVNIIGLGIRVAAKPFSIVSMVSKLCKDSPMTNLYRIKSATHPYKQEFRDLK